MKKFFFMFALMFFVTQASAVLAATTVNKCEEDFKVTDEKGNVVSVECAEPYSKIKDNSVVNAGTGGLMLLLENGNMVNMPAGSQIFIPLGADIVVQKGEVTVTKPNIIEPYRPASDPGSIFDTRIKDEEQTDDISPVR